MSESDFEHFIKNPILGRGASLQTWETRVLRFSGVWTSWRRFGYSQTDLEHCSEHSVGIETLICFLNQPETQH